MPVAHVDYRHLAPAYGVGQNGVGDVLTSGQLDTHFAARFLLPFRHRVLKEFLECERPGELVPGRRIDLYAGKLIEFVQDERSMKRAADGIGYIVNLVRYMDVIAGLDGRRLRKAVLLMLLAGRQG